VFGIFPRLKERAKQLAGTMSGGEQQMLAMGRALMARPKVLLMDEPSMGLSPIMVDKIFEVVADIHKQGTTILLVEQNASRALALADRGYVMESGEITMQGEAKGLLADPRVRAAYSGNDRLRLRLIRGPGILRGSSAVVVDVPSGRMASSRPCAWAHATPSSREA